MSSDLLGNSPYEFMNGKDDSNNIAITTQLSPPCPPYCDDNDDDKIIGHLQQNSTYPATTANDQQMQQRVKSPSKYINSNWTTNTTLITNDTTDTQKDDDDHDNVDLRQAIQLTWAALDTVVSDDCVKDPQTSPSLLTTLQDDSTKQHILPTQHQNATATISALSSSSSSQSKPSSFMSVTTVRIYITDFKNYKSVQLTNLLTTAMVIQYFKRKGLLDSDNDWALFEIATENGIERPLRLWEVVSDVTSGWERNTTNTLLIKKYDLYKTLAMDSILDRPSLVHGWLNIECKKRRWQKRYCFIKDHVIYHAEDNKYTNSDTLCHLASFDVYTLLQRCSTSPTPFVFALKVQGKTNTSGEYQGHVRLFTAENQSCLETWVLGIRQEKSILHYQINPRRVKNPLAVFKSSTSNSLGHAYANLKQRHKFIKSESFTENVGASNVEQPKFIQPSSQPITDAEIKRRVSRRCTTKTGITRNQEHHEHSLDGNTEDIYGHKTTTTTSIESNNSNSTLVHIDDKFQFSKGSLLDKGTIASTATTPTASSIPSQYQPHDEKFTMRRMTSTRTANSSELHQRSRANANGNVLPQRTCTQRKGRGHNQQQDASRFGTNMATTSASGATFTSSGLRLTVKVT